MRPRSLMAIVVVFLSAGACFGAPVETTSASPLGNVDGGKNETAIGDLVADSIRETLQTQIAFVASSELRLKDPPIPAGKVSSAQIAALASYPNDPLAILSIQGKAIKQALEKSVAICPQRNQGFLQVSGLRFTFDPSKPVGSRATSVTIGSAQLSDNDYYSVGVTSSMANGALGYWKVWTKDDVRRRLPDQNVVRAVESYFKGHPTINYGVLDRVSVGR